MAGPVIQNFTVNSTSWTQCTVLGARRALGYEVHLLSGASFLYSLDSAQAQQAKCFGSKEFKSRGGTPAAGDDETIWVKTLGGSDTFVVVLDY